MADIPANQSTGVNLGVGGYVSSQLEFPGDQDWVRVQLVAFQLYDISVFASGSNPLDDPFLAVYDANGFLLDTDDDGGIGLNAYLDDFSVFTSGTYYIAAGHAQNNGTGTYTIALDTGFPVLTNDEIATQLTDGYWEFAATGGDWRAFDISQNSIITVNITNLTAAGKTLARAALVTWEEVTGLDFREVSGRADIRFDDNQNGAFANSSLTGNRINHSNVNIGLDWLQTYGTRIDSYSYQTYIHEIGHAIGLGHAGNYNNAATYPTDAWYRNDCWQATVMSYFDQTANTFIDATKANILTPMIADIIAIQRLYGFSGQTRPGDTTYGYGTNAGATYDPTSYGRVVAWTIWDTGGTDTLNGAQATADQRFVLAPEGISDAFGQIGNVCIAQGVVIENAIGGSGDDTISGNSVRNVLQGRAGADILLGQDGGDVLRGLTQRDRLVGGKGADTLYGGTEGDTLTGSAGPDRFVFETPADSGTTTVTRDAITDFVSGEDEIVLTAIDARTGGGANDAAIWIGQNSFSGTQGQLRYERTGGDIFLELDRNGDRTADFMVEISGINSILKADIAL
jgi:serralysin